MGKEIEREWEKLKRDGCRGKVDLNNDGQNQNMLGVHLIML
jgi:hypothetical protein